MGWLHRIGRTNPQDSEPEEPEEPCPVAVERAAPGVAALFDGLSEDGSHAVLDLGPAVESHLRLFSGFARRIRFAGLLPRQRGDEEWTGVLRSLTPHPEQSYDLVLAWDLLDRLSPEARPPLINRLAEITGPGARLYMVVDASEEPTTQPFRFALLDTDCVSQWAVGPPEPAPRGLLPAQVERLLGPFEVVHAFTLRSGMREYVAVKR